MRTISTAAIALIASSAIAAPEDAKLGMVAYTAWECHTFASQAGDTAEAERLFNMGMDTSREFVSKVVAGEVSDYDIFQHTPLSVAGVLRGPSEDFIIGRIYQMVSSAAFDKMSKKDASGMPLETKDWNTDPAILKGIAETKFRQSNCSMIKP